jgi:2-oxoglutarate dehydrogenase E1 component
MSSNPLEENQIAEVSFLEKLYDLYQTNPEQLDHSWQKFFQSLDIQAPLQPTLYEQKVRIERLCETYRRFGHLIAKVNPISLQDNPEPPQLKLDWIGFNTDELDQSFPTLGLISKESAPLKDLIEALHAIYCRQIGFEYKESYPEMELWIQKHIESPSFRQELKNDQRLLILKNLNKSELFESFLHTKYTGQKRFSLEGAETLIPMLALLLETGANDGLQEVVIGMAHRGRLNVLANILNKSYRDILTEFEEGYVPDPSEGMGDVKYHKGFAGDFITGFGKKVAVTLSPNPSHLESVCPVVEGQARAKQFQNNDETDRKRIMPILIHGDAAICGQGVVYETLQFSQLKGYKTGGTIHFIINNQIGFTTIQRDLRSTCYTSSISRAFGIPAFHVNAEDPDGCIKATLLALEIRQRFHCDVFIDLNCYRKYGHNEGDEPAFTQPLEYQIIRKKTPIREIYHDQLIRQGTIQKEIVEQMENEFKQSLQEAYSKVKETGKQAKNKVKHPEKKDCTYQTLATHVSKGLLEAVAERFSQIPADFTIHPKVENLVKERLKVIKENRPVDWGLAEFLAFGTLLWEGTPVRLSGQDCGRGTFSQRHALWVDQSKESEYYPLSHLKDDQGRFEVYNSSLSEMGILGFEYGYSVSCPQGLTIWEAQYGDFNNGAQIIIDQYISSGEEKWGQKSGLVLFLPHGYEGQGPEHSSGRLERFLSLTGNRSMYVVNPSTPAQYFHVLRRQMRLTELKPLIIFTPKALLRLPACTSPLQDFENGSFQTVIDDPDKPESVKRIAFCSGHIYYDLIAKRAKEQVTGVAIIRIEQLNPIDEKSLMSIIQRYNSAKECFWVQEEPQNMGAWSFIQPYLNRLLPQNISLHYIGREPSATPATGSRYYHEQEQANILKQVFQL